MRSSRSILSKTWSTLGEGVVDVVWKNDVHDASGI